jgi:hypothetical protein
VGLTLAIGDGLNPYIEDIDPVTRRFCRDLWKHNKDNAALLVLTSFDQDRTTGILHREATWRCYQHIYAPKSTFCTSPPKLDDAEHQFKTVIVHLAANKLIDEQRLDRAEKWVDALAHDHTISQKDDLILNTNNLLHIERVHVMTFPKTGGSLSSTPGECTGSLNVDTSAYRKFSAPTGPEPLNLPSGRPIGSLRAN